MRIPFILCTLFTLCISGTAQAMLARVFPRVVTVTNRQPHNIQPYHQETLIQQIHEDQARTYLQTIQHPDHDTKWHHTLLQTFLSERAALSGFIDAVLHDISGSDLASLCCQRIVATERDLLDPKSTAERSRYSVDGALYAKTVEDCLVHTVRAQLRCKAPRLNPFERTLGRTTFDVEAFEQQYNINLAAVTWEEQEDRSTALLKAYLNTYCNTGSADDRHHATGGIHHVIRLMRLERSHDLSVAAGKLLSEPQ